MAAIAPARRPESTPYRAYGGAAAMWRCRDIEILMDGPAGTGKTRGILEKAHRVLIKYAGCRVLAVRKTRASMTQSVLVTYENKVLPPNSPIKRGANRANRASYKYPNGSELVIGGLDNADRIMSTEYDLIIGFEWTEATEEDHEKLLTRLRNGVVPYQQLIADCNPSYPSHWLNQRAKNGQMTRILSRHSDNPSVTPEYLATLNRLTGARRLRLLEGKWAAQEGLVYPDFDEAIHVIKPFEIPAEWPRYRSIDFGFTNPFVCQFWAIDPDGRVYLYKEIYKTKQLVPEHAAKILDISGDDYFIRTFADPEDADGREELKRRGIYTYPAQKSINLGIQKVQEYLKIQEDGKPRFFIFDNVCIDRDPVLVEAKKPTSTIAEMENYRWPDTPKNSTTEKEVPIDENNHGLDAARYFVYSYSVFNRI